MLVRASKLAMAGACVSVIMSGTAYAQNQEIIVTARKVEENLQEVPIAITTFTGEAFEEAGLTEFADIAQLTPNFDVRPRGATGSLFANLTIRGQTSGFLTLNADQAVGININGAPITRGTSLFSNLFDIEQIEILRGPQGTLFGKNTTGGAVVITTKAPDLDAFGGYAKFTVGSFNRTDGELVANIPLAEGVAALRLGGAITHRDGFGEGGQGDTLLTGRELADDDEYFLRGSLLVEPSDNVSIQINADYHELDESTSIFRSLRSALGGFVALESTNPDFYVGNDFRDEAPFVEADEFNINGTINVDLGAAELTSITSFREQNSLTLVQSAPSTAVELGQNSELFAQEVRLSGQAANDRLSWQTGVFYSEESGIDIDRLVGFGLDSTTEADNETLSVFGQATLDLTDRIAVTGGVRWTDEKRKVTSLVGLGSNEASFDGFSWLGSIDLQATDNVLVYASIARGFRSGAIDQDNISTIVQPEFVTNYEIGLKSDLFDDIVRFNAAAFYSDYTDIQRTSFDPDSPVPVTVLRNAAEATIWGLEAELSANLPAGLSFGASAGYTNAKFDEFLDADGTGNVLDRSDEPIGGPEWQFNGFARYDTDLSDNVALGIQGNVFYIGDEELAGASVAAILAPGEDIVPGFTLVNAQVDFDIADLGGNFGGLNVALFGTNLFDKEYYAGGITLALFGGIANRIVGEPRQWGIRVTKDF
jgi:iron complex outermembrane receptor protein